MEQVLKFDRAFDERVALYLFQEFAGSHTFTISEQSKELEKEFLAHLRKKSCVRISITI